MAARVFGLCGVFRQGGRPSPLSVTQPFPSTIQPDAPHPAGTQDRVLIMPRNPVLDLPLAEVLRPQIALSLQHVCHVYTVGQFLRSWGSPSRQKKIEQMFDSPEQARHAATVCAAWLGIKSIVMVNPELGWWRDEPPGMQAAATV